MYLIVSIIFPTELTKIKTILLKLIHLYNYYNVNGNNR